MTRASDDGQHFLPDFGLFKVAIRIILLAVLIAAIITISRHEVFDENTWQDLNLLTGFALILSVISVMVLKLFSPLIRRMSVRGGSLPSARVRRSFMSSGGNVCPAAVRKVVASSPNSCPPRPTGQRPLDRARYKMDVCVTRS